MKKPFNEDYWEGRYGPDPVCERCGEPRPIGEINAEAIHHHGAHGLACIDRKACERRRRRNARRRFFRGLTGKRLFR